MTRPTRVYRRPWFAALIAVAAILVPATPVRAIDLFQILVTNTDGSGVPDLLVGGSSLPDLLNNLVNMTGAFADFDGVEWNADITFMGVQDAINVTFDPVAGEATLTFSLLGGAAETFVFNGGNLAEQIENFLQGQLSQQVQAFLNAINTLSLVAVTDGSPMSTTALSARYIYDRFGLHADLTAREQDEFDLANEEVGLRGRVDAYYDRITTDAGEGNSIAVASSLQYVFNERVSLGFLMPIAYHNIEGSQIVNVHFNLAVPINVLIPGTDGPLGLRTTPFGTLAASGSVDLIAGGLIGGGGLVTTLYGELGEWTISGTNQFSFHEGITLRYEDWEFDPGVSQTIMKNGVKVTRRIGEDMFAYGAFTLTNFLDSAAVDEYTTPEAGFGWRKPSGLNVSFGYRADIGNGYESHSLRATFQLPF